MHDDLFCVELCVGNILKGKTLVLYTYLSSPEFEILDGWSKWLASVVLINLREK